MDQALRDKMCARMREVQTQVAERDELIEVIAIALLTRKKCLCPGRHRTSQKRCHQLVPRWAHRG